MGFPNSPSNNQEEIVNGIRYRYNSTLTAWIRVPVSGLSKLTSSTTPPSDPSLGDQWYDTNEDVLYEWINDGTSSYWIDIQSGLVNGTTTTVQPFHPFLLSGM